MTKTKSPIRIHEHGCGSGANLFLLKQLLNKDFKFSGSDISKDLLEHAKSGFKNHGISFKLDNAQNSRIPNDSFNIMFSSDLLGHLPDLENTVRNIFN